MPGYLLDTHTFLWFVDGALELPENVRRLIEDPSNDIHVSIASFWEIGIKAGLGRLPLSNNLLGLEAIALSQSMTFVPITVAAISAVQHLAQHHKDPFDRIIAATAITSGLTILSADAVFDVYGVSRVWS